MIAPHRLRNQAANTIRNYFVNLGLLEVISPLLVTSPAIEPHLDAFTVKGSHYPPFWLPTSPEFGLKKILALEPPETKGVFEIAHAFRDDIPSRLHAAEFTMVEWYLRHTSYLALPEIVKNILQAILTPYNKVVPEIQVYSVEEYCYRKQIAIPAYFNSPLLAPQQVVPWENLLREFTLFWEQTIHPLLRQEEAVIFLHSFPKFVRGMAELDSSTGLAQRIECFYRGIELANGYQEISDLYTVEELFRQCNAIRNQLGKTPYPVDEMLLHLTPAMKGVAGMALGLERLLMAFFAIDDIRQFSQIM